MEETIKDFYVMKTVCGAYTVFSVWENSAIDPVSYCPGHTTITHIDGVLMGRVGTRNMDIPGHLKSGSDERILFIREAREKEYQEAYGIILAFESGIREIPMKFDMGEIEINKGAE